jgi:peptidoglycan/xylan/chitin deacetylase (PgdA/CDA1 family)
MEGYYRKILTKKLSPILHNLGIHHLTKSIYSGKGQILMFHRVLPYSCKERIHNHLSIEISPEQLIFIISYFKTKNYDIISLDMLPEWLKNEKNTSKKFVVFTFDDGYKDNLEVAYPILKKHNIPFTIYITTSFPDKRAILWWYILEDLILKNDKIQYVFLKDSVNIDCSTYSKKEKAFTKLRKVISTLNAENFDTELTGFFSKFGFNTLKYNTEMTLSWSELTELSKDPLVTIGAHTLNHYNLCDLSDQQSFYEISESKKLIESKINSEVKHFSYPFGVYGKREIELAKRSNFLTATTTKTANIFYNHIDHLLALPRISINSLTNEKVLDLHVNGFFPAILNSFIRIVH